MTDGNQGPGERPLAKAAKTFSQPAAAKPVRPWRARLFLAAGFAIAAACATLFNASAFWPTPFPLFSTVALAALVAVTGAFGTFETVDGLAEYTSLAMPIGLSSLLLLDWRHFLACVALGEFFQFVSETARRTNPTVWYVRCFNVASLAIAGFCTTLFVHGLSPLVTISVPNLWASPAIVAVLIVGALIWQVLDELQTWVLVTLAAELPLSSIEFSDRRFLARMTFLLVGIPFAFVWRENVWIAILTLAPLGKALGLLGVSELEHRSQTDARTGLLNAGRFDELLDRTLDEARRDGTTFALLVVDIDNFKAVNDRYGHPVGDRVIQQIAAVLSSVARANDVVARVGGEEFALILPGSDRGGALSFAERLRRRVAEEAFEFDRQGDPLSITTSVGVAMFPADALTPSVLYASADAALYAAKRSGRNQVCSAQ